MKHMFGKNNTKVDFFVVKSIKKKFKFIKLCFIKFQIIGRGYSNVPQSTFSISYPNKLADEFYLLYLYDYSCRVQLPVRFKNDDLSSFKHI